MRSSTVIAASLCILAGCATGGASRAGSGTRGSANVITAEEIAAAPELATAFDAVQRLRPQFLQSRGQTSLNQGSAASTPPLPTVFIDNQQVGDVASLRDIPISEVQEIRYLSAGEATTRWGTGHVNGVIQVIRRTQ